MSRSFAILLFLAAATINADTLILRDGRRIEGRLIRVENGVVEFQQGGFSGQVGQVNRNDVQGIEFGGEDRNDRNDRNPSPQASQQTRPRGLREKSIMVVANAPWTDSGIDIVSGQNIYFEASGNIKWGPGRTAGPGGESNSPYNAARPMPNHPGAALIARTSAASDPFFIGNEHGAIRLRSSGRLYLGINDDVLGDNSGYFRVVVYY
ncbi:MAG TPA: hypothetical protein VGK48_27770 [Terriglobia bacterium]|jgi:hypothetical protein